MEQYDSVVSELNKELDQATARIRSLEQACRKHVSMLQELEAVKTELEQTVQHSSEWQQKHACVSVQLISWMFVVVHSLSS
jgi:DNA repair ATPase RecN